MTSSTCTISSSAIHNNILLRVGIMLIICDIALYIVKKEGVKNCKKRGHCKKKQHKKNNHHIISR